MADSDPVEQHEQVEEMVKQDPAHLERHQSDKGVSNKEQNVVSWDKAKSASHLPLGSEKKKLYKEDSNDTPAQGVPRTSTQLSRRAYGGAPSEFDRRLDGPFGRPSLAMTRRSSAVTHDGTETERAPSLPAEIATQGATPQLTPDSVEFQPEPPPLDYDLWSRKWWILFFWTVVVFDSVVCPVALYFGLWYGLHVHDLMSANTVFSIVTAAVGGMSILEYFLRLWKLVKKTSNCRVVGAKWWYLDSFHWNFTFAWILIMVELIVGTVQDNPPPRLITMVVPTMLYVFAVELLIMDGLRLLEKPSPVRISSIPKGAQVRPGIYSLIEDVVAVDGSGGTAYREALNRRYEASHIFRAMLRRLGLFWSIGSACMAILCTILIFTVQLDAAYTIGWAVPFIWAGIWAIATIWYVKKMLRAEKIAWAEEIAEKS